MKTIELERDTHTFLMALIGAASVGYASGSEASSAVDVLLSSEYFAAIPGNFTGTAGEEKAHFLQSADSSQSSPEGVVQSALSRSSFDTQDSLADEAVADLSPGSPVGAEEFLSVPVDQAASLPNSEQLLASPLFEPEIVDSISDRLGFQSEPDGLSKGLSQIDDTLYGNFRDSTYQAYYELEASVKELGVGLTSQLEAAGVPIINDLAIQLADIQYVDTLSKGPSEITSFVRATVSELNLVRQEIF